MSSSLVQTIAYFFPDMSENLFSFSSEDISYEDKITEISDFITNNNLSINSGDFGRRLVFLVINGDISKEFFIKEIHVSRVLGSRGTLTMFSDTCYFKSINEYHDFMFSLLEIFNKFLLSEEPCYDSRGRVINKSDYDNPYEFRPYFNLSRSYNDYGEPEDTIIKSLCMIIGYMVYNSYYDDMEMCETCQKTISNDLRFKIDPDGYLYNIISTIILPKTKYLEFVLRNLELTDLYILKTFFDNVNDDSFNILKDNLMKRYTLLKECIYKISEERGLADE